MEEELVIPFFVFRFSFRARLPHLFASKPIQGCIECSNLCHLRRLFHYFEEKVEDFLLFGGLLAREEDTAAIAAVSINLYAHIDLNDLALSEFSICWSMVRSACGGAKGDDGFKCHGICAEFSRKFLNFPTKLLLCHSYPDLLRECCQYTIRNATGFFRCANGIFCLRPPPSFNDTFTRDKRDLPKLLLPSFESCDGHVIRFEAHTLQATQVLGELVRMKDTNTSFCFICRFLRVAAIHEEQHGALSLSHK